MNTLKISKGKDISISVDETPLCFVTEFVAKEVTRQYKIEEFLSENEVCNLRLEKKYMLYITALSHLDSKVFEKEDFTLKVYDENTVYEYCGCRLTEKVRDVKASTPMVDKYTIVASQLKILEGLYE